VIGSSGVFANRDYINDATPLTAAGLRETTQIANASQFDCSVHGKESQSSVADITRLKAVAKRYGAKEVVLFEWKRGKGCNFSRLTGDTWTESTAGDIFG
jgi:hypothetical protein